MEQKNILTAQVVHNHKRNMIIIILFLLVSLVFNIYMFTKKVHQSIDNSTNTIEKITNKKTI